jgi:hypothetical protein
MKPVWMVRSRQIAQRLSFWLALIGYDPHDRSLSHRIYLIYASIFMSLWGFAVLSLAASGTATVLTALGTGSVNQIAAQISLLIFVLWFIFQLRQVSRRSPFVFSEEDAYLICQTPVKRNIVALSWFVGDWLAQALPFWALGVTFGFAMMESQIGRKVVFGDIFLYAASGLRAWSILLPLHLGLLALLWTLGALRLQGNRERHWLPRLVLIGILMTVISLLGSASFPELLKLLAPVWHAILSPMEYPLQAAFSIHPWINGILIALGIAVIGLAALTIASRDLNLSRAAQESTQREKLAAAQRYGMVDLAREIKQRERLGIGRDPTRMPARPGLWVLPWKDILQSRYEIGFGQLWNWLILLGTSVGFLLAPDFNSRILILFYWLIVVSQRTTSRLRADLRNWWLLRSLPFHAEKLLLGELAIPWGLTVAIAWLAIILGGGRLGASRLSLFLLIPPVCLILSLISAYDVLRQSSTGMLLNANVPGISWRSLLGGMLCLAILAGMMGLLRPFQWIGMFLTFAASVMLAYGAWRMAARKYRSIS